MSAKLRDANDGPQGQVTLRQAWVIASGGLAHIPEAPLSGTVMAALRRLHQGLALPLSS
jgi:hypothetical protein